MTEPSGSGPGPEIQIYLGSASPRRRQLLGQLGLRFHALVTDVDEGRQAGETADVLVQRLARSKARAALQQVRARAWPERPVLGADTEVAVDGEVLGKPEDLEHAAEILQRLSGRTHTVVTALALAQRGGIDSSVSTSEVTFKELSRADIENYWATGEPRDKAGAYAIQGLGAIFISRLVGSYSGVMGLPLYELNELLLRVGIRCL